MGVCKEGGVSWRWEEGQELGSQRRARDSEVTGVLAVLRVLMAFQGVARGRWSQTVPVKLV